MTHPAKPHPLRTALVWVLRVSVSVGLLYYLSTKVDIDRVWGHVRTASLDWLAIAFGLYLVMVLVSTWRWNLLLRAQHIELPFGRLFSSYLVATFFSNFLPSNIGGDVVRIGDTARSAGSKTLATTVVLIDRGIGLLGLVFVAAVGSTVVANSSDAVGAIGPGVLWTALVAAVAGAAPFVLVPQHVGRLLRPLRVLHQEWVDERLERLTTALAKFKEAPVALAGGFAGAVVVQAILVGFYAAIARALHIPVPTNHLAILVPLSFIVQMLPVSVGGLGVREDLFRRYFIGLGLAPELGFALSLTSFALILLFSVSGAVVYLTRKRH